MNTAIIVAAGSGTRFGAETPKQFQDLNGKPVISHTISPFQNCGSIDRIILVVPEDRIKSVLALAAEFSKISMVVVGGASRAESVLNGLQVAEPEGIIAVHDGARPLVTTGEIEATVAAAEKSGAACLVVGLTDTIKKVRDGKIKGTPDRSTLRSAVTPQCFRYELIMRAYNEAESLDSATDDSSLVEAIGHEVTVVEGNSANIKITVAADLAVASVLLEKGETV